MRTLPSCHSLQQTPAGERPAGRRRRRRRRRRVPGLLGAADPAAVFGDDEAEVHPQPAVGGASVGPHVGARLHDRELDLETETASQRRAGNQPGRQHNRQTNLSSLTACCFGESLQQRARLRDALTGGCQFFS